jgi:hypothetical protein
MRKIRIAGHQKISMQRIGISEYKVDAISN